MMWWPRNLNWGRLSFIPFWPSHMEMNSSYQWVLVISIFFFLVKGASVNNFCVFIAFFKWISNTHALANYTPVHLESVENWTVWDESPCEMIPCMQQFTQALLCIAHTRIFVMMLAPSIKSITSYCLFHSHAQVITFNWLNEVNRSKVQLWYPATVICAETIWRFNSSSCNDCQNGSHNKSIHGQKKKRNRVPTTHENQFLCTMNPL